VDSNRAAASSSPIRGHDRARGGGRPSHGSPRAGTSRAARLCLSPAPASWAPG
jgi:hypothetical protein